MGTKTTTRVECDLCGKVVEIDGDDLPDRWYSAFFWDDLNFLNRGQEKNPFQVACQPCVRELRVNITLLAMALAHKYKPNLPIKSVEEGSDD